MPAEGNTAFRTETISALSFTLNFRMLIPRKRLMEKLCTEITGTYLDRIAGSRRERTGRSRKSSNSGRMNSKIAYDVYNDSEASCKIP